MAAKNALYEQRAQTLDRILNLKDYAPFILVCDSLEQPADRLLAEFEQRMPAGCKAIHLAQGLVASKERLPTPTSDRTLFIIHDVELVPNIGQVIQSLVRPNTTVIGVFHEDLKPSPATKPKYAPSEFALVDFMATTVLRIVPNELALETTANDPIARLHYNSAYFNRPIFRINVEVRRKSGRALEAAFDFNSTTHEAKFVPSPGVPDPALGAQPALAELTTFNLELTDRQRQERETVALPFLDAQEIGDGGAAGGAIIYQFEKDDDYDEEDPYEDPF